MATNEELLNRIIRDARTLRAQLFPDPPAPVPPPTPPPPPETIIRTIEELRVAATVGGIVRLVDGFLWTSPILVTARTMTILGGRVEGRIVATPGVRMLATHESSEDVTVRGLALNAAGVSFAYPKGKRLSLVRNTVNAIQTFCNCEALDAGHGEVVLDGNTYPESAVVTGRALWGCGAAVRVLREQFKARSQNEQPYRVNHCGILQVHHCMIAPVMESYATGKRVLAIQDVHEFELSFNTFSGGPVGAGPLGGLDSLQFPAPGQPDTRKLPDGTYNQAAPLKSPGDHCGNPSVPSLVADCEFDRPMEIEPGTENIHFDRCTPAPVLLPTKGLVGRRTIKDIWVDGTKVA